jgi:uncharacterized membrane protein YbhN (UPF0104 family)
MQGRGLVRRALSLGGCAACVALFAHAVMGMDLCAAAGLLRARGPWLALALAPFLLTMLVDCVAWGRLLGALGHAVPLGKLLIVRLATEAAHLGLPGGGLIADGLNPFLLTRAAGVPAGVGAVAMGGRKWLIMRGHGVVVVLGAALGYGALDRASSSLLGVPGLPLWVLASAALPLGLSYAMSAAFVEASALARAHRTLARLPVRSLRLWLARRAESFREADADIRRLAVDARAATHRASALYLVTWLMEALESFAIARLVGIEVGFSTVLAFEAALSVLRAAAVFAPAGLGLSDVGYLGLLGSAGVASPAAAAFVLLKRLKELAWILIGGALLVSVRRPAGGGLKALPRPARIAPAATGARVPAV